MNKFCRITSENAFNKAILDKDNYPNGDYIDWNMVEYDVSLEIKKNVNCSLQLKKHYVWFDRAVGLYIDKYGDPNLQKIA